MHVMHICVACILMHAMHTHIDACNAYACAY